VQSSPGDEGPSDVSSTPSEAGTALARRP
jgi:hypothetical protein